MIAADVEPMTVDRLLNVELPDLTAEGGFPGGHLVGGTVAFRWRWNGTEFEAA